MRRAASTVTVSILTQVVSWVRRVWLPSNATVGCFNPHPSCLLGATSLAIDVTAIAFGFNPHPSCLLGATSADLPDRAQRSLFQSSPKLSPGCDDGAGVREHATAVFQSSPKLSPGCDACGHRFAGSSTCFNPHPSCLLGATVQALSPVVSTVAVSILTQVVSWVRHRCSRFAASSNGRFNPHPSCLLGATCHADAMATVTTTFQSSPKLSPGCDGIVRRCHTLGHACFNPHPSCLLGATVHDASLVGDAHVSILTQVVSWVRRVAPGHCRHDRRRFQSSPKLSPGCDAARRSESRSTLGFNPHPSCLLGATRHVSGVGAVVVVFQSSPKLSPGCDLTWPDLASILMFQSSPKLSPGCDATVSVIRPRLAVGFNPHPSCLLGATARSPRKLTQSPRPVSILTQVVSWVRPHVMFTVS